MSTEVDKNWAKFLEWIYKTHSIVPDWKPNKVSIELWEEFRRIAE